MLDDLKKKEYEMYKMLIDQYLQGVENVEIKKLFDSIILTTHDLVIDKIKSDQINHKISSLVTTLSSHNKTYFKEIIPEAFDDEKYRRSKYYTLRNILSSLATY